MDKVRDFRDFELQQIEHLQVVMFAEEVAGTDALWSRQIPGWTIGMELDSTWEELKDYFRWGIVPMGFDPADYGIDVHNEE